MHRKRLLITDGSRLVPVLIEQGYDVMVQTRNPEKTALHFDHTVKTIQQLDALTDTDVFDVVINLAGQGITDRCWTPSVKRQLRDSRIITTQKLIHYPQATEKKSECFISGSAIKWLVLF